MITSTYNYSQCVAWNLDPAFVCTLTALCIFMVSLFQCECEVGSQPKTLSHFIPCQTPSVCPYSSLYSFPYLFYLFDPFPLYFTSFHPQINPSPSSPSSPHCHSPLPHFSPLPLLTTCSDVLAAWTPLLLLLLLPFSVLLHVSSVGVQQRCRGLCRSLWGTVAAQDRR